MRPVTQAAIRNRHIKEDTMYHWDTTAAIARQHRAGLLAEASNVRLVRELRAAARQGGTAPRAGRRWRPRLILNPARAR